MGDIFIIHCCLWVYQCMDEDELLGVFGLKASLGLSRSDIERISPMLVQQVAQGCGHQDDIVEEDKPSAAAGETLKKKYILFLQCLSLCSYITPRAPPVW